MNTSQTCSVDKQAAAAENDFRGASYVPAVDVVETAEAFVVTADLPGVSAERIDVQYEDGELRIHAPVARRQAADQRYLLQEYGIGDYYRSFRLGTDVDATKIEARSVDGVLTLKLPKVEAVKPRRIAVNTA